MREKVNRNTAAFDLWMRDHCPPVQVNEPQKFVPPWLVTTLGLAAVAVFWLAVLS